MKYIKEISKIIITIIISILIILEILLNVLTNTMLKEEYILKKLEESNYYERIYQEIQNVFSNYILQSGLDETTIQDICTKEQVQQDIKIIINNMYQGTENKISTKTVKEKLKENIQKQLENTVITDHTEKAINRLIDTVGKEYENKVMQTQNDKIINGIIEKGNKQIKVFILAIYMLMLMLIISLILIIKKRQKIILWIGISMLISGAFLAILNISINSHIVIENVNMLAPSISTLVQVITNDILSKMLAQIIIVIVIGIILIFIGNIVGRRNQTSNKNVCN